jgi:hypothetical protein
VDEDDVLALGAEYGQDAIFKLTPADRRIIGCAGQRVTITGWSSRSTRTGEAAVSGIPDRGQSG